MITAALAALRLFFGGPIKSILVSLFTTYWKQTAVVIVCALVYFYHQHLTKTIETQKTTIAVLQQENATVKENNQKLENALTASNESISLLAKGAAQTSKDFSKLNNTVKSQTSELEKRLKLILSEEKPVSCEATIQYLIDAIPGYKK